MAVQQNKKSPSKRGMHRAHDFLPTPPVAVEPTTGEVHLRHHISPNGFYRGRKIVRPSPTNRRRIGDEQAASAVGHDATRPACRRASGLSRTKARDRARERRDRWQWERDQRERDQRKARRARAVCQRAGGSYN